MIIIRMRNNLTFLFLGFFIFHSTSGQVKTVKKEDCKGTYSLSFGADKKKSDSVHISGSITAIQRDELFKNPYCYLKINGIKYNADKDGNFDFKIKPGKYSVYARNPHTYGLTTSPINFLIGNTYFFNFYLLAQIIAD